MFDIIKMSLSRLSDSDVDLLMNCGGMSVRFGT